MLQLIVVQWITSSKIYFTRFLGCFAPIFYIYCEHFSLYAILKQKQQKIVDFQNFQRSNFVKRQNFENSMIHKTFPGATRDPKSIEYILEWNLENPSEWILSVPFRFKVYKSCKCSQIIFSYNGKCERHKVYVKWSLVNYETSLFHNLVFF